MNRHLIAACLALGLCLPSAAAAQPAVRCTVTPDREALPSGSTQTVVIKVALDAAPVPSDRERPPVNLALVLDRSGSMGGDKIARAREAAIEALHRLGGRDRFSVVAYNHRVETLVPSTTTEDTSWIEDRIRGIRADGNTALFGAVSQGAAEVRKHLDGPYVHRVILLSDGLANVGPSTPRDLGRLGTALGKEGISVTTVGVGTGFNEDLMTRLAGASDGNHYFVESSRDLPRIFAAELGDVLSVVARRVTVEVEVPDGVRPLRIIGREGRILGNRVELQMNQVYGGQQKFALVEVEVPATAPDQTLELAVARCSYDNALTQVRERGTATTRVRFTPRPEEVRRSADRGVQEDVVKNRMAEARDQALDLYNAGRKDEAAKELRQVGQVLEEQAAALGLDDLADEAKTLDRDAAEFEAEELDAVRKKSLRSESYRVRSQQQSY